METSAPTNDQSHETTRSLSTLTREALDFSLALLDDGDVENTEVGIDNAATYRLALALAGAAGAVRLRSW